MIPVLWRASLRFLWRHPWQTGLTVLGIALGVAVVVAIDLANDSARRGFSLAAEQTAGRATHQVIGGPRGLDESVYRALRMAPGDILMAPVIDDYVAPSADPERSLRLLGVDPFAEARVRGYVRVGGGGTPVTRLLAVPGAVLMAAETADSLGIAPGEQLEVLARGRTATLTLAGYLETTDPALRRLVRGLVLTDIASAQEILGEQGRISHVDLVLPTGAAGGAALERLRALLPAGAAILPAEQRSAALGRMTEAFHLNLSAMSLLALLVGTFLIYNTTTFSVVRRRPLLGSLRTLGVTRRQIFRLVLAEAAVTGLVGALLGLGLGLGLAELLLRLVTRTINDIYFVLTVRELSITASGLAKGLLLGVSAALLAALPPALEAALTPPRAILNRVVLEARLHRGVRWSAAAGAGLALVGAVAVLVPGHRLALGYVALVALVLACALLTPKLTLLLVAAFRPLLAFLLGALGNMAARGITAHLSRTGVAAAALMVAVAATVGVGTMVASFRDTVVHWLDESLRADVYVAPARTAGGGAWPDLGRGFMERVAGLEGVAEVASYRRVVVESATGPTQIVAAALPESERERFRFRSGAPDAAWTAFRAGSAVLISEPYAFRHGLAVGDTLELRGSAGPVRLPVAGVFYDYRSDQGVVYLDAALYRRLWNDEAVSSLGVHARPDVDIEQLMARIRALPADGLALAVRANRELFNASVEVFDRTFTITTVLRLLAVVVAFVGVLSALLALHLERAREMAVLRVNGLTPRQVWLLVTAQTGLMGLTAGLLAVPAGLLMARVLTHVINYRAFGWTLQWTTDPAILGQAVLLALSAGLLAGVYPAWLMARTPPALALRGE